MIIIISLYSVAYYSAFRGECQKQVSGVCDAKFKKFDTRQQAEEFLKSHNVVLLTLPENVTHRPTPQVIQPTTAMKVENLMAPRMNAVPKVSPSDTKLNTVYQAINSLEEKISKFMDEMGNSCLLYTSRCV